MRSVIATKISSPVGGNDDDAKPPKEMSIAH